MKVILTPQLNQEIFFVPLALNLHMKLLNKNYSSLCKFLFIFGNENIRQVLRKA